jgi:hypothetical protein
MLTEAVKMMMMKKKKKKKKKGKRRKLHGSVVVWPWRMMCGGG